MARTKPLTLSQEKCPDMFAYRRNLAFRGDYTLVTMRQKRALDGHSQQRVGQHTERRLLRPDNTDVGSFKSESRGQQSEEHSRLLTSEIMSLSSPRKQKHECLAPHGNES